MVSLYCMDFKHMAITFHIYFLFACLFVCLFLTEKVIAMSFPSSGKHKMYRNPISVSLSM